MEILGILLMGLLIIGLFAVVIGSIVFIARDAGKHDQSVALWVVLSFCLGNLGLAIYLFVTKRTGWGLFWLLVFPVIFFALFFFILMIIGAGVGTY